MVKSQPSIECAERSKILEFGLGEVEKNDFLGRLKLEEFEGEAEEGRGTLVGELAADVGQRDGTVEQRGSVQAETMFFPVKRFKYTLSIYEEVNWEMFKK
jgi:hypothetical protein